MEKIKELLNQYSLLQLQYVEFEKYMKNELENLLIEKNIKYQQLTGRIKTIESIEKKLISKPILIERLNDDIRNMNDLCGIRIILYDNYNLNAIFQIIQDKYDIVEIKSKGFDYNANNITLKLKNGIFSDFLCEIQLVTIMSHNLIEIGHDIVYKNNELMEIDKKEMELISNEYNECLESVYKLETKIDILKKRAENVNNNYSIYNHIISKDNIDLLKNNCSSSFFYQSCNEIKSIVGYLSRNEKQVKIIQDNKLLVIVTNNLCRLNDDGIYTKEFIFDNYTSVMEMYVGVWIENLDEIFKEILEFLDREKNPRMNRSFFTMIKNITQYGIKDNNWYVFNKINEYINKEEKYPILVAKMINSVVDNNITYPEITNPTTVRLVRKDLSYTEKGKEIIESMFSRCCNFFLKNQDEEVYDVLIELVYKFDFLVDELLNFFDSNRKNINDYYRYDVFRKMYYSYGEKIKSSNYYKLILKDDFYSIWKFLYYDHFDEEFSRKDWRKVEKRKEQVLNEFIGSINEKNIEEIERIINCYQFLLDKKISIPINLKKHIYLIGKNYDLALELYKKTNNPYLYLGLKEKKVKVTKRNDLDVLNAINTTFVADAFNSFLCEKRDYEKDKIICKIIINHNLYTKKDNKNKLIEIVSYYNKKKHFIEIDILSEEFLMYVSKDECDVILENFKYAIEQEQSFIGIDFMELFQIFPENTRKFIKELANDDIKLDSSIELFITSAKNYKEERKNNILLVLELLNEKEYFQIWRYVSQLIDKRDSSLINDLLEIIEADSSEKMLKSISKLLYELEININEMWKIIREIIQKTNDEETKQNVEYLLTKIDSANSFYDAYKKRKKDLNQIKKKENDEMLKKSLNNAALHCSKMMDIEKLREVKRNEEMSFSFSK